MVYMKHKMNPVFNLDLIPKVSHYIWADIPQSPENQNFETLLIPCIVDEGYSVCIITIHVIYFPWIITDTSEQTFFISFVSFTKNICGWREEFAM